MFKWNVMPKNNPFKTPANFRRCSSRNFPKQIIVNRMFMISAERCHMPTSPARKLGPNLVGQQVLTRSVFFFNFLNHAVACKDSHEYIPNVTIAMFPLWCAVQHCNETTISWFMLMALLRSQQWLPLKRPSGSLCHFYSFSL